MTTQEKFASMVALFSAAIVDQIKAKHGATYIANTANLKAAAFAAMAEVLQAEPDCKPMLAVAVWESVMHVNDSAFHQGLEKKSDAGTVSFKVVRAKKSPATLALEYIS